MPKKSISRPKKSKTRSPKKSRSTKKSPKKSDDKQNCTMKFQAKYKNRPSPPYPANECCGKMEEGNDGLVYTSVPNKNGVCRWVKTKA